MFSNEFSFLLFGNYVYLQECGENVQNNFMKIVYSRQLSDRVGCITVFGVGMMGIVNGSRNSKRYLEVIDNIVTVLSQHDQKPRFQDDLTPRDSAKIPIQHYKVLLIWK